MRSEIGGNFASKPSYHTARTSSSFDEVGLPTGRTNRGTCSFDVVTCDETGDPTIVTTNRVRPRAHNGLEIAATCNDHT